jgi:hypothetical protein
MNEPASIIPTANVIVSYSADAINKLFESGGSSKNLLNSIEEDSELLLFNKESNPNFISFDYSFGLGGGQHIATLKFLDPENEFESRFFTKGFAENVAGFKRENPDNALLSGEQGQRPATYPAGFIGPGIRQTDVDSALRNQFIERYKKAYGNKNLYIAYGSGFDTATWAGPYQMYMTGANIEGAKGKVITLQLTPTPKGLLKMDNRTATGDVVNLSMNGLYTRTTGESDQVNFALLSSPPDRDVLEGFDKIYEINPYSPRKGEVISPTAQEQRGRIQEVFLSESSTTALAQRQYFKGANAAASMAEINYHDMIVDCLKDYIAKATGNPNVIVLLPNLNLLLLDFIQEEVNKLINAQAPFSSQPGSHATVALSNSDRESREAFKHYSYLRQVLMSLGFSLTTTPLEGQENKDYTSTSMSKQVREAQYENETDQYLKFIGNNTFNIVLNTRSSDLIANHEETLIGVMDKLKAGMKGRYPLNPVTFVENNEKWTGLWGTKPLYAKHRTFAGNGKVRYQKNREAIIFGDLGLIKSYLYATKDLVKTAEDPLEVPEIKAANKRFNDIKTEIQQLGLPDVSAVVAGDPQAVALSEQLGELKTLRKEARFTALNAFISFAGTNILGPLDRSILDEEYQKEARETILSKIDTVNKTPFGNLYEVPEEFSIGVSQLDEEDSLAALQKASAENRFPIFKYNTSNPNVVQLKTDVSLAYYAAMQMGWQKSIDRQAAGVVTGLLTSKHATLPVLNTEEAINFLFANNFADGNLDDKVALIRELEKRVSHSLVEDYNLKATQVAEQATVDSFLDPMKGITVVEPQTYNIQTIAAQIGVVASQMQLEGNAPVIMVDQEKPGDPTSIMAQLLTQAQRRAFNVTLKTTPLFHLSTVGKGMLSNCLLFAQDPPVIKTGTRPTQNFFNTFLSGMYQIVGFKHKIDATGEASSEFTLIGGPISTTEKEND